MPSQIVVFCRQEYGCVAMEYLGLTHLPQSLPFFGNEGDIRHLAEFVDVGPIPVVLRDTSVDAIVADTDRAVGAEERFGWSKSLLSEGAAAYYAFLQRKAPLLVYNRLKSHSITPSLRWV